MKNKKSNTLDKVVCGATATFRGKETKDVATKIGRTIGGKGGEAIGALIDLLTPNLNINLDEGKIENKKKEKN